MTNNWLQQHHPLLKAIQKPITFIPLLHLWGLPISNDIMHVTQTVNVYLTHTHTHWDGQRELILWLWIRGCCSAALLKHNNISNPLSLLCAGVWCLSLSLFNGLLQSEWRFGCYESVQKGGRRYNGCCVCWTDETRPMQLWPTNQNE